jgi:5-methyltetrahydrofolate--homocysteine methyltransferase
MTERAAKKRPAVLLDGAMGTRLWALSEAAGILKAPTWTYNLTHPEFVTQVAREYAEAGSQILLTNTFAVNAPALRGTGHSVGEGVSASVRAAAAAAGRGVRVALDVGPLGAMLEPCGELTAREASEIFDELAAAGVAAGAELVMFETFLDLAMLRVAVRAARRHGVPVLASMTFQQSGRTMMGDSAADIAAALAESGADAVGLNCSLGPAEALPILWQFAAATELPLIFKPNAGLPATGPDGRTVHPYTAERFAAESAPALELAAYVGACCGSDAGYIRQLKNLLSAR